MCVILGPAVPRSHPQFFLMANQPSEAMPEPSPPAAADDVVVDVDLSDAKPPKVEVSCAALFLIGALTSFPPLTMEIYIPSLPTIEEELHTSSAHVLSTISVYTISFGVTQLVLGPLSDVYGRRGILLVAMAFYTASSAACTLAPSVEVMYAPRIVQGAASAGAIILGQAILRDLLPVERRESVTSKIAVVRAMSPMLAPVLGSFIAALLGWRANFGFLVLLGLYAVVGTKQLLAESLPKERRQPRFDLRAILGNNAYLLSRRDFTCWAVPEALGFGGFFVWISCSSYILQGFYGVPLALFGPLYSITFIGAIAGSAAAPRLRKRGLSPKTTYAVGGTLSSSVGLLLAILSFTPLMRTPSVLSQVVLQACMVCYIFGRGVCMVQAQVQSLEPFPTRAASAAGLMGACRMASVSIVSVCASTLNGGDPAPACRAIALLGIASHLSHLLLRPRATTAVADAATATAGDAAGGDRRNSRGGLLGACSSTQTTAALSELNPAAEMAAAQGEVARTEVDAAPPRSPSAPSPPATGIVMVGNVMVKAHPPELLAGADAASSAYKRGAAEPHAESAAPATDLPTGVDSEEARGR